MEIFENDLVTFSGTPADVRDACRELGLDIVTLQPFRDFEGMPPGQRERAFARAERKFDVMQELGCDLLMICSNVSPDSLGGIDRAAADLRELGERAARRGLRIAFEALAWGRHINDYRDSWEAVRRADHPAVGLVLDSFHILARGTDLSTIRSIPGDRIFLVQLADAPLLQMDYLSWSRHFRNFPGQGDLPILDFMKALHGDRLRRRLVARDLQRPVPRRLGAQRRDRRPSLAALHARPARHRPDRPCRRAHEGAGRRASSNSPPTITTRRGSKGCWPGWDSAAPASIAPRRSRDGARATSTSWSTARRRASPIPSTSCTARRSARSASTCPSTRQTFQRATLLLDTPFHQAVAPGELDIPAVRGVGGSLLYFLDQTSTLGRVWDIEFEPTGDVGGERRRPHHRRSRLAIDAVRGDAELAAVLHLAARGRQSPGRRRSPIRAAWSAAR